jgi:hypothetical protein
VATDVVPLTQVPPVRGSTDSEIDAPAHTVVGPLITGVGLIVMVALPVMAFGQPVAVLVPTTV